MAEKGGHWVKGKFVPGYGNRSKAGSAGSDVAVTEQSFAESRARQWKEVRAKYGISRAEFEEFYPETQERQRFYEKVQDAARKGASVSAKTLDSLAKWNEDTFRQLAKFSKSIPAGYLPPSVRAASKVAGKLTKARGKSRGFSPQEYERAR